MLNKDNKDIDNFIQDLVVAVTHHQGLHFKSIQEADAHAEKTTQEMNQLLQQSSAIVKEGLNYLAEKSSGFVKEVSQKLHDHLQNPEEVSKIIGSEIQSNPQALTLFSEAVNNFYDCGDYHLEQCVLSVFLMLFPVYPQPYACYATLVWRKEGIEAAKVFYEQIVDHMEDPVLDYFAADCFLKAGDSAKAKKLLQRAHLKTQSVAQEQQDLRQHIRDLLRQCN